MPNKMKNPEYYTNFTCPECKQSILTKVIDTRRKPDGRIMRRRQCKSCRAVFITYEQIADTEKINELRIKDLFKVAVKSLHEIHTLMQDKK